MEDLTTAILKRLDDLHAKFDAFRDEYLREHAIIASEARRAHDRITAVEKDLDKTLGRILEIEKLMPWLKATAFIISALAIPVILAASAFIWQTITHKIIFP